MSRSRASRFTAALAVFPLATLCLVGCSTESFGLSTDGGSDAGEAASRPDGATTTDANHEDGSGAGKDAAAEAARAETGVVDGTIADVASVKDGAGVPDSRGDSPEDSLADARVDSPPHDAAAHDANPEAGAANDAGSTFLGTAKEFVALAGEMVSITAATTPPTTLTGDIGVSPGTIIATLPTGQPPGTVHADDAVATKAQSDLSVAYATLAGFDCPAANDRTGLDLGGQTLTPGVYCFSSSAGLTGALVLDAQGDANARWVLQIGTTLTTAAASSVTVIGGGSGCNVFWQVGTSATLGASTALEGTLVAAQSITVGAGATLSPGRALARAGFLALDGDTLSATTCP